MSTPFAYLHEREIIAELRVQFYERQPRRVLALATVDAVAIRIINVSVIYETR
jgi:hypothetical protein